jgi:murein L,D-transpeptidase YafK
MEIKVKKSERVLEIHDSGRLLKSYPIVLGSCPVGMKEREGDGRTPEGEYFVRVKNEESKFHLSLGLNYPSAEDAARGVGSGLIGRKVEAEIAAANTAGRLPPQRTPLGGEIYIHGGGTAGDWTQGCIGMADGDVEDLFSRVEPGTRVIILP